MIIGASLTHNDKSKGWLNRWLEENIKYFDKWIILDDASSDGTFEELKKFNHEKMIIAQMPEETFKIDESKIRNILWQKIKEIAKEGDYVFVLDSDEIICPEFLKEKDRLTKINAVLTFKKIELWDEKNYRIDSLWSNYFDRMFPYRNMPWGYDKAQFHYPQIPAYAFLKMPRYNANVRVLHLAYSTEELRKAKYDFMMNNPQQKKDITYKHLQSINKTGVLKEYKEQIEMPKIFLAFFFSSLYKLPEGTKEFLKNHNYEKDKLDVVFYASNCSPKLVKDIEELDIEAKSVDFRLFNYREEEYNNKLKHRRSILKREFFINYGEKVLKNPEDYDYFLFVDGDFPIDEEFIMHHILLDKDVAIMRSLMKSFWLSKKAFVDSLNFKNDMIRDNENLALSSFLSNFQYFVWGSVFGSPFPINIKNS